MQLVTCFVYSESCSANLYMGVLMCFDPLLIVFKLKEYFAYVNGWFRSAMFNHHTIL